MELWQTLAHNAIVIVRIQPERVRSAHRPLLSTHYCSFVHSRYILAASCSAAINCSAFSAVASISYTHTMWAWPHLSVPIIFT